VVFNGLINRGTRAVVHDIRTATLRSIGLAAHPDSDWTADQVDGSREAQDELCDLYWYADLFGDEVLMLRIQRWQRNM
jgi:hypothetical protein